MQKKRFPVLMLTGMGVLLLPAALRPPPRYQRTAVDGVTTIDEAAALCRRSGLQGWALVQFAQQLVAKKFAVYSARNLWDTPARAFAYGMGYCTQYNLALKQLLDQLGMQTTAVFALKTRVFDNEAWNMGHTWLRVTIDGETRDVCAGRVENRPGQVNFEALSQVQNGRYPILLVNHLGMILFCGFLEWKALLTGSALPAWMYKERER